MGLRWVMFVVFAFVLLLGVSSAAFVDKGGGVCECGSCGDCTNALAASSTCSTVELTQDIDSSSSGGCIQIYKNNVIFDLKGKTISNSYLPSLNQYVLGISIMGALHDVTVKNGKISGFPSGINAGRPVNRLGGLGGGQTDKSNLVFQNLVIEKSNPTGGSTIDFALHLESVSSSSLSDITVPDVGVVRLERSSGLSVSTVALSGLSRLELAGVRDSTLSTIAIFGNTQPKGYNQRGILVTSSSYLSTLYSTNNIFDGIQIQHWYEGINVDSGNTPNTFRNVVSNANEIGIHFVELQNLDTVSACSNVQQDVNYNWQTLVANPAVLPQLTCGTSYPIGICGHACSSSTQCRFLGAEWQKNDVDATSASVGESVQLVVYGENCDGETVNFELFEQGVSDGSLSPATDPSPAIFSNGIARSSWVVEDLSDQVDTTAYYFVGSLESDFNREVQSNVLSVGDGVVNSGCELAAAQWSKTEAIEGEEVSMTLYGPPECVGEMVDFQVWEHDVAGDDKLDLVSDVVFSPVGIATTSWTVEYDENDEPVALGVYNNEYRFIASISDDPSLEMSSSYLHSSPDPNNQDVLDEAYWGSYKGERLVEGTADPTLDMLAYKDEKVTMIGKTSLSANVEVKLQLFRNDNVPISCVGTAPDPEYCDPSDGAFKSKTRNNGDVVHLIILESSYFGADNDPDFYFKIVYNSEEEQSEDLGTDTTCLDIDPTGAGDCDDNPDDDDFDFCDDIAENMCGDFDLTDLVDDFALLDECKTSNPPCECELNPDTFSCDLIFTDPKTTGCRSSLVPTSECVDGHYTYEIRYTPLAPGNVCPASVSKTGDCISSISALALPVFGWWQVVMGMLGIGLVYVVFGRRFSRYAIFSRVLR
ncbi:MAG TPA: hypothetical protein VJK51_00500 [Candidatus Nanoarchaeia archaeon]|nr:hypothetical protein [Candidatus Nanoarchaeia archaeon]